MPVAKDITALEISAVDVRADVSNKYVARFILVYVFDDDPLSTSTATPSASPLNAFVPAPARMAAHDSGDPSTFRSVMPSNVVVSGSGSGKTVKVANPNENSGNQRSATAQSQA
jgi:hypothetical protein